MAFHQESSYHLGEDGKVSTFGINMKSELRKGLEGNTEIPYSNNGNNSSGASNCTFASQFPRFACHGGSNVEGQWKQDYQSRGGSGSFDFG
jgi:hypothetical protein